MATTATETCYRHPDRETRVQCSNCGRPICPDCMTPTPVGMRCPECSKEKTQVRTINSARQASAPLTVGLMIACVVAFIAGGELALGGASGARNALYENGVLFAPFAADGEWWRLASYGFLHSGLLHIGFNMYLLYLLGTELETDMGTPRFALLYVAGLLGGAAGAMLANPAAATVGASGAVFGLMGFTFFAMRARGFDPMASGIGPLILLNLVFSFVWPNVSWGGHVGGLVAGAACALLFNALDRRRGTPRWLGTAGLAAVTAAMAVAAVGAALAA